MDIEAIGKIIEQAERFKNSYFWSPPKTASGRRNYEEYNTCPYTEWVEGQNTYTAAFIVECSCKNIYAKGNYTRNGKKTTLTAIKNSYRRLREQE